MFRILLLMLMFTIQAASILMPEMFPFPQIRKLVGHSMCATEKATTTNIMSFDEIQQQVNKKVQKVLKSMSNEEQAVAKPVAKPQPQPTAKPQAVTTPKPTAVQQPDETPVVVQ